MYRHAKDDIRDSLLIYQLEFVGLASAGQATGNRAVSFFGGLTEKESRRNYQNRQRK